jgi:MFS superfamily sulfate permease-like transporter
MIIGILGIIIILFWDNFLAKKHSFFKLLQGSLVAVFVGTILQVIFSKNPDLLIDGIHLVQVPVMEKLSDFTGFLTFPDFSQFLNPDVIIIAFTLALVASLETLLSVEATDKLDPEKNVTPTNRELFAQGFGNIFSGLIGGLPITQVIVRSSANLQSNAKTKLSTILHGFLLLISVLAIPTILNHIPKAVLSSVLILVGYKLAKPALFIKYFKLGWTQYLPFIVTIIVIVFKDLLWGIFAGLTIGIIVVLVKSFQNSLYLHKKDEGNNHEIVKIRLAEEVTFLNKANIRKELNELKENSTLELDIIQTKYLDHDVIEILEDFVIQAKNKNIKVQLKSEATQGCLHL